MSKKKCRHEDAWMVAPGEILVGRFGRIEVPCEQRRCADCGELVSLGEANTSGVNVKIEIRAADLARGDAEEADFDQAEWAGWNDDERHSEGEFDLADPRWLCGYLAEAIYFHRTLSRHDEHLSRAPDGVPEPESAATAATADETAGFDLQAVSGLPGEAPELPLSDDNLRAILEMARDEHPVTIHVDVLRALTRELQDHRLERPDERSMIAKLACAVVELGEKYEHTEDTTSDEERAKGEHAEFVHGADCTNLCEWACGALHFVFTRDIDGNIEKFREIANAGTLKIRDVEI